MEDARIAEVQITGMNGKVYSVFGVFDGHGGTCAFDVGTEVSKYV